MSSGHAETQDAPPGQVPASASGYESGGDPSHYSWAHRVMAAEDFMTVPLNNKTLPTLNPGIEVARRLGVDVTDLGFPTITVVGSKGKGTAAIAASAALAHAGLSVGTVTSPSLITARERIRIGGRQLDEEPYVALAEELSQIYADLATEHPDWSLPRLGGLSLLGGLRAFSDARVDAAVLEASMGGGSDLTRIVGSPVVVITEVFGEHLGVLGNNVAEIAVEKLRAVTATTKIVVTVEQSHEVRQAWESTNLLDNVTLVVVKKGPFGHHPQPLIDRNLELGRVAAAEWRKLFDDLAPTASAHTCRRSQKRDQFPTPETPRADAPGWTPPATRDRPRPECDGGCSGGPFSLPQSIVLPARCQPLPGHTMIDCAISPTGARAAIADYTRTFGRPPQHIFVMMPATKDDLGVKEVLDRSGIPYTCVDLPTVVDRLRPNREVWPTTVTFDRETFREATHYLAFGTVTFAAAVLAARGGTAEQLW